jgi:DNA-damage-inducible protein J
MVLRQGGFVMPENAVVRARINAETKETASVVLAAMGLTVSDAFRMLMTKIAQEKALPFDPLVPNTETIAAMQEARQGKTIKAGSVDSLFEGLNADD